MLDWNWTWDFGGESGKKAESGWGREWLCRPRCRAKTAGTLLEGIFYMNCKGVACIHKSVVFHISFLFIYCWLGGIGWVSTDYPAMPLLQPVTPCKI